MADNNAHSDPVLRQMLDKREDLARSLDEAQARLGAMDRAISEWASANGLDLPRRIQQVKPTAPVSPEFNALALPAATRRALELVPDRSAKTASEILEVLERHNASPTSKDPVHSVQVALNRRSKSDNDVIHTRSGKWGLREWYSDDQLVAFAKDRDGANARDKARHLERMKEGIQRVKGTGAHYGAAPKITPLQWERALELVNSGVSKMSEIHREIIKLTPEGEKPMVAMTITRQKEALFNGAPYPERWKAYFEAHPPKPPVSVKDTASIRRIK